MYLPQNNHLFTKQCVIPHKNEISLLFEIIGNIDYKPDSMTESIKILSLNVRGLGHAKKRKMMFSWCRKQKADIVLIQETHSSKRDETKWRNEWGGQEIYFSHGTTNSLGTAILIKSGKHLEVTNTFSSSSGRYIGIQAKIDKEEYIILNIYAPNSNAKLIDFYKSLSQFMKRNFSEDCNIIIGGDFNCPFNPIMDKRGGNLDPKKKVITSIIEIMNEFDLQDIWRVKNPYKKSYTWSQKNPRIFCRLDYWLTSSKIHDNLKNTDIIPAIRTDHSAITTEIILPEETRRGPNYWKFNNLLLSDPEFVKQVKENLREKWINESSDFPHQRTGWDWIKFRIREFSVLYSKERAKKKKEFENEAQVNLNLKKDELEKNPCSETETDFTAAKQDVENIYQEKTEGNFIRSRLRWYEEGEKSSKYFFGLEKRNYNKKHMKSMNVEGKVLTDPKEIREAQRHFYSNLYSEKPVDLTGSDAEYFLNIPIENKLDDIAKNSCEGILTLKELSDTLPTFQNNKSPGNDGLSIEFYKTFWNDIGPLLLNCLNEAYIDGEMSSSQRQAVITLIEKKDKDRDLIENWRPLSLTNVDSKIASKAIARRIQRVLPDIVHHNQSGFMKNRSISETIRTILDIMDYTSHEEIPGILLFVDFEKAFDTVSRTYLNKCLEAFNFGPSITQWVSTFYNNTTSCVMNNGFSSGYFDIKRGVRQGDPLSPYVFLLVVETLAQAVRSEKSIKGIKILDEETKILQYADDTTSCLSDKQSLKNLLDLFNKFEKISGLKMNYEKTEAFWIGSCKHLKETPFGLRWAQDGVKSLGVYFTYKKEKSDEHNFENKLSKMQKLIDCWRTRNLTIFGKILIIKSLVVSNFVYIASVLPIPKSYISRLETMIFRYLWRGPDKVTRKSTYGEYEKGGIRMLNIKNQFKSLRLSWIKKMFDSTNTSVWKKHLEYILKPVGGSFFLLCNYNIKHYQWPISTFYRDLLSDWQEFKNQFLKEDFGKYIIWNNKNITINGRPIFYKYLFDKGIVFISDLYLNKTCGESIDIYKQKGTIITNYIQWLGLRNVASKVTIRNSSFSRLQADNFIKGTLEFTSGDSHFTMTNAKCKFFYCFMTNNSSFYPQKALKLQEEFNLNSKELELAYSIPYSITNDNYLRQLQFKVLNFILYDNSKLKKFGITDSDNCSFCSNSVDSMEHMIFLCEKIQIFWRDVFGIINTIKNTTIPIDKKYIFLGVLKAGKHFAFINFAIILAKSYIYTCKRKPKIPTKTGFLQILKEKYTIEKELARRNSEKAQNEFKQKWNGYSIEI